MDKVGHPRSVISLHVAICLALTWVRSSKVISIYTRSYVSGADVDKVTQGHIYTHKYKYGADVDNVTPKSRYTRTNVTNVEEVNVCNRIHRDIGPHEDRQRRKDGHVSR